MDRNNSHTDWNSPKDVAKTAGNSHANRPPRISIVVPVFNEEQVINQCYRQLTDIMRQSGETYELLFVNDGSTDNSARILRQLCDHDENMVFIDFSRNFGHQAAISAGMDYARGDAVVVIDADLQDPPSVIIHMIEKWREGYEVVYGKRTQRHGETVFKKFTARLFYRFLKSMTDVAIPTDVGDFRLIDRKVCEVMRSLKEKNRFIRGLISWIGFRQIDVEYVREKRFAGKTKYPLAKMVRFAADAIISFSFKPLRLASWSGFCVSTVGFGYLCYVMYLRLFTEKTIQGWTSLIAINLLFSGFTLSMLGIIGEYIGRIYDESKERPLYIVREKKDGGRRKEE